MTAAIDADLSTRHLVDSDLHQLIDAFPPVQLDHGTLPAFRNLMQAQADVINAQAGPDLTGIVQETASAPSAADGPDVSVLVTRPETGGSRPAILHIHGGGMVMGFAGMNAVEDVKLVRDLDCVVVAPDYRLAPETSFPGPLEDCYSALAWMTDNAKALGIDPNRIVVLGDSAGGGLAAALTLYTRDTGGAPLSGQVLVYPMLDHRTGGPKDPYKNPTTGEFIWTRPYNQFGWQCLQGDYDPSDDRVGWFSPALAKNLHDLPPAAIITGSLDLFLDENLDYARRLVRKGVPVNFMSYAGAIHAFPTVLDAAVTTRFLRDRHDALARLMKVNA